MNAEIIISIIAVLIVLEGAIIAFNPNWTRRVFQKLARKNSSVRTLGIIEIIIGILLFLISVY